MNVAAGLFVPTLVFLLGKDAGAERNSGYCIGNSCFTLFRDPGTFSSAQRLCRDQNSHLMTVRTSVSSDVLSVLLGNLTGSYWIGLHRMSGCPDPSEELRGFQWVTKDAESDFVNWQPDPDDSCSAARCVSVNGEENFKWSQTPCDRPAAGFLCENVEDVRSATLPRGSIATLFPSKTKYICGTSTKRHCGKPECPAECDPNYNLLCFCPDGYVSSERGGSVFCIDIDECESHYCEQKCRNTYGGYVCSCYPGFKLVGEYRCREVSDGDEETTDVDSSIFSSSPTSPTDPTERPSAVTAGGLVGIIVSTVFVVVLAVFAAHTECNNC
uniref:Thrombomodulin n=1 Tax=Xiphophorus couchianus TaxID=32473 RepID=A0A3B5M047_9TELE